MEFDTHSLHEPPSNAIARGKKSRLTTAENHRRANIKAAKIVIREPQRYDGVLLEWARRILDAEGQAL